MRENIIMFKPIKMIVFFYVLSWAFTSVGTIAQTTTNLEDNIIFSGDSLEGIDTQSIGSDEDFQYTPKFNLTLETEKESSTIDVLFEGLREEPLKNDSPIDTINKINTNQGEGVMLQTEKIDLTIF